MGSSADKGRKHSPTSGALAIAQNLANEIRLWTNDAYFQQANGIAWKEAQLAKKLDSSVLAQLIHEAGNRLMV